MCDLARAICYFQATAGSLPFSGRLMGGWVTPVKPQPETSQSFAMQFQDGVREAPLRKLQGLFGHCPNGGGGLDPCPDGLGHLFREELSMFKGAVACFGGSEPLPG